MSSRCAFCSGDGEPCPYSALGYRLVDGQRTGSRLLEVEARAQVRMGSERSFGIVFSVLFVVVGLEPLTRGSRPRFWLFALGLIFVYFSIWKPESLTSLNRLWSRVGNLLGGIVAELVMLILFCVVIIPTSVVLRALRKGPFDPGVGQIRESNWQLRGVDVPLMGPMKNQF